jgi:hypothetical protein
MEGKGEVRKFDSRTTKGGTLAIYDSLVYEALRASHGGGVKKRHGANDDKTFLHFIGERERERENWEARGEVGWAGS